MCDVCRQYPCAAGCPNSRGRRVVYLCSGCRGEILEFDEYFDLDGFVFCAECVGESRRVAGSDE